MKINLTKLNSHGVAHHAMVAVLVISAFAGFGAYRVFQTSAAANPPKLSAYGKKSNGCRPGQVKKNNKCTAIQNPTLLKKECDKYKLQLTSNKKACKNGCQQGWYMKTGNCTKLKHPRPSTGNGSGSGSNGNGAGSNGSGSGSNGQSGVKKNIDLKVGTYNLQRPSINPRPDEPRIKGIAGLIKSRGLHIVGVQEASEGNLPRLMKYLPGHYKATSAAGVDDVIVYDSRILQQTNFGRFAIPKIGANNQQHGRTRDAVWVKLKFKDAKDSVYVINMHADTAPQGRDPAANAALAQMNKFKREDPKAKVIILGDMNSNYTSPNRNQIHNKFKSSGDLKLTSQATNNRKGYNCDTQNGFDSRQDCRKKVGSHLDQIWVSRSSGIEVKSWENVVNKETLRLSDHNPVITNLKLTITK